MNRKKLIAGNWKMNTNFIEAQQLTLDIAQYLEQNHPTCDVLICPPFPYLAYLNYKFQQREFYLGAQNCAAEEKGAFTGDVAADMLVSCGVQFVLIGHSERRSIFGESNELINRKIKLAIHSGLKPVFCIGETLAEREAGKVEEVIANQIELGLAEVDDISTIIFAYEPVWAIGTGKTASPEQAQEVHAFIRTIIEKKYSADASQQAIILYGGSCNAANAASLFAQKDIDGGLIGGASLKLADFSKIIEAAQ